MEISSARRGSKMKRRRGRPAAPKPLLTQSRNPADASEGPPDFRPGAIAEGEGHGRVVTASDHGSQLLTDAQGALRDRGPGFSIGCSLGRTRTRAGDRPYRRATTGVLGDLDPEAPGEVRQVGEEPLERVEDARVLEARRIEVHRDPPRPVVVEQGHDLIEDRAV